MYNCENITLLNTFYTNSTNHEAYFLFFIFFHILAAVVAEASVVGGCNAHVRIEGIGQD